MSSQSSIQWQWTMHKPQVPLAQELHTIAIPIMQQVYGFSIDLPIKHVAGDIYFGKDEIKAIHNAIKHEIKERSSYPNVIHSKLEAAIANLHQHIRKTRSLTVSNLSNKNLLEEFNSIYRSIAHVTAFMSFKGTVQMSDILEEQVKEIITKRGGDKEKQNNFFLKLSIPYKPSPIVEEIESLQNIQNTIDQQERERLLDEHTKQFAWMGCVMYSGEPYKKDYFRNRLNTKIELKSQLNQENQITDCMKMLNLSPQEKKTIEQFRVWCYLRTHIKDWTSKGIAASIPLLKELASRVKMTFDELRYLGFGELQNIFTQSFKEKSQPIIQRRKQGWGALIINATISYYDNENLHLIEESSLENNKGITGLVTYKGIAKGRVVVVKSFDDFALVQQDDILVTHMTTTNFVPILSKVAAIITDEGGITCHAAIISRELEIPCIIGTRTATKALKTGMYVEVDATNAIVKIL